MVNICIECGKPAESRVRGWRKIWRAKLGIRAREEKPGPWKPRARATRAHGEGSVLFGDPGRGRGAHDGARQEGWKLPVADAEPI